MSFLRFLLFFNLFFIGCVSIDLPKNILKKSNFYTYKEPNHKSFKPVDSSNIDKLWMHSENGNSISVISDCSTNDDPSLKQIAQGITSGIQQLQTKSTNFKMYNNRKALFTHFLGDVDGVTSEFDLVVLKKNGCIYTLTHVATKKSYAQTKDVFESFITTFKVQ